MFTSEEEFVSCGTVPSSDEDYALAMVGSGSSEDGTASPHDVTFLQGEASPPVVMSRKKCSPGSSSSGSSKSRNFLF